MQISTSVGVVQVMLRLLLVVRGSCNRRIRGAVVCCRAAAKEPAPLIVVCPSHLGGCVARRVLAEMEQALVRAMHGPLQNRTREAGRDWCFTPVTMAFP